MEEANTVPAEAGHASEEYLEIIERDLDRTFPHNDRFVAKGGDGQIMLRDVLRAYAMYNKELGYCQGMGMLAGTLLMQMPPEDAFWCLVRLLEEQLDGFFDSGLKMIQLNATILHYLLQQQMPDVHALLDKQQMEPLLYATDWFMCVFVKTLPWATVLRIWDMLFMEGPKVLFRVCLGLIAQSRSHLLANCTEMHEQMMYLRDLPAEHLKPAALLEAMSKVKLTRKTISALHAAAEIKFEKDHPPKATPKPKTTPVQAPPRAAVPVAEASLAMATGVSGGEMLVANL